ncbi:MAG: hypothetical protein QOK43_1878 [Acidimicrobiaceae bacterium]|nr:hypothetical protein [Acidimicrobiaceae bacterium]MDQ1446057.1 hypothetical protein [Acidimicrobiaceae bacterium]
MTAEPDPVHELARLWRDAASNGEHIVLPPAVTEQLELRAIAYQAALATGERVLHPSLIAFLGQ